MKEVLSQKEKLNQGREYATKASSRRSKDDMGLSSLESKHNGESEGEDDEEGEGERRLSALGRPDDKCNKCGGTGHIEKDCSTWDKNATHKCYNCDGKGHYGRECPSRQGVLKGGKTGKRSQRLS